MADPTIDAPLGNLIPWPDDEHYPNLDPEEALELYLGWAEDAGFELWDHQEEALLELASGANVILGTPTGSGKSLVALGLLFMATCTDRRSYYTAPIKALVSEKFFYLCDLLGKDNVGMITGDVVINAEAPIVCCTAEILANDALRLGPSCDVGAVAMDEFHFFADQDRGWAWQVPLLTLPKCQFLLMSATLGDTSAIEGLLERMNERPIAQVTDAPRPVPLAYEWVDTALEPTCELLIRRGAAPIYAVHFTQDGALRSATALASYGVSEREQRDAIKDAIAGTRFTTAFGKTLRRLLLAGVGVHHAGMLPRYRLLVEKLAPQGLLPVICGTDTLGVGINVPIHTVLLTALAKYDGRRQRRLNAREFHQIAGRAGRAGFDAEGLVVAQATEYDIERARALAKVGGDPKRARGIKTRKPPAGFVSWNEQTFTRLAEATPEALRPRLRITNAIVLDEVLQGGDAFARTHQLVNDSLQTPEEKEALHARADEIFATLVDAGVIEQVQAEGTDTWRPAMEIPEDFALDQPLSPFLLAALELLDPESETYALDLISMVEATLEDPFQILRAQERAERDRAMAQMKADGVDYDERIERIAEVTYPRPLAELLETAYAQYCEEVPWARDFSVRPKSILREMVETASDFKGYIQHVGIARSEGLLLRYLSDAYRVLSRTVPEDKLDERLEGIVSWLSLVVRTVDSSLIDEWEGSDNAANEDAAGAAPTDEVVHDRRGLTLLVRNALFARVRLISADDAETLGTLDADWGWRMPRWKQALDAFYEEHEDALTDGDARSSRYFVIDTAEERTKRLWHATQTIHDDAGDDDFRIVADVDLDATQEEGSVVFTTYRVGFPEDLA